MPQVQRIDPIVLPSEKESVAAYCRVSTDSKDQLNSYHAQISYYTQLINDNPDWVLYDLYADRGITGTSMEKRDEFKRMLADCREGKIKRILVKSVSRFTRNTTELLEVTRELKDLGVVVVFEEQGYDTSQMMGEMLLTMHAMAAQEESLSISKNMRWSYQKRMASGNYITNSAPYGYRLNGANQLTIDRKEAETVKTIFQWFLEGKGKSQIAHMLNQADGVEPGKGKWHISKINYVLTNEKYVGDSELQKKYTLDSLSHNRVRNKGEKEKYYIESSHPAIIDRTAFVAVQRLLEDRNKFEAGSTHLFTHRIMCPSCGRHYRLVKSSNKPYWVCPKRANSYSECPKINLREEDIIQASINLLTKVYMSMAESVLSLIPFLREIEYKQAGNDSKLFELDQAIAVTNDKSLTLNKLNAKGFISADEYRVQSEKLAAERQKLTTQRNKKLHGLQSHSAIEKLEELQAILSSWPGIPTEFDIDQFDEIVEKIIPTADNKLIFRLHCGLELTEELPS